MGFHAVGAHRVDSARMNHPQQERRLRGNCICGQEARCQGGDEDFDFGEVDVCKVGDDKDDFGEVGIDEEDRGDEGGFLGEERNNDEGCGEEARRETCSGKEEN